VTASRTIDGIGWR